MSVHPLRAAGATVSLAISLLCAPTLAQAAPPCSQWGFAGRTNFNQSNGWTLGFDSTGPQARGRASAVATNPDGDLVAMYGTVSGAIDGYAVNLEVRWDNGPFGKYEGSVDANGFASGTTYDVVNRGSAAGWSTQRPLQCVAPR